MWRLLMSGLGRKSPSPRPPPPPACPVQDRLSGAPTLDVEGIIRQASTRVTMDQLVRTGKRYIHVLSGEKIQELIHRSVRTIVEKYRADSPEISKIPAGQIAAESKAEFDELLEQFRQTSQAKDEIEQSKQALDQELESLRKDLETEKAARSQTPARAEEPDLAASFDEFARELEGQIDRVFEKRRLLLERAGSPEAVAELQQVEGTLRKILSRILDLEHRRFEISGGEAKEIAMLNKRIAKLSEYISSLENSLKTLSNSKIFSNQQVQNILRKLGLAQEDQHFEKKREMLKIVLSANQQIRKEAKALEERGISLASPAGAHGSPATGAATAEATMEWTLGRTG